MKSKRLAKAGLALGLIGGSAAGFALTTPGVSGAQTDSTTPSTTAPSTTDARPDREAKLRESLQPLLDNGTLNQSQLDAVVGALKDAAPLGGHRGGGFRGGADLSVAATTIGISADDLRTALESGQSIADVAASKGVDVQSVIDAMVAAMNDRLAEAVSSGKLTQEKADELKADAATRIADVVNGVDKPGRGFGGMRPNGGTPPAAPSTTTS